MTNLGSPSADLLIFLESTQAEAWMQSARRLPPGLLLEASFPSHIPLKKLADAHMRFMPRETKGPLLAQWILHDIELHRFSKSILDLSKADQQSMLAIFEEFRHALGDAAWKIYGLFMEHTQKPHSKETLLELQAVVHRLAGSAGSYGLLLVSKAAKTLEVAIENHKQPEIQTLTHEFLEMLSWFLPPTLRAPPLSKTLLIYNLGQQTRMQHMHGLRSLGIHAVWGMDWVACWEMAQTHSLDGAVLNMDDLPVESWPQLFEALGSLPAFAALPKYLVKHHANDAERACAARLNCLGPGKPPSTFEELAEIVQVLF